jgi:hypothetical protein
MDPDPAPQKNLYYVYCTNWLHPSRLLNGNCTGTYRYMFILLPIKQYTYLPATGARAAKKD